MKNALTDFYLLNNLVLNLVLTRRTHKKHTYNRLQVRIFTGDPGQIRTADPSLRRRMLYPTELRNRISTY